MTNYNYNFYSQELELEVFWPGGSEESAEFSHWDAEVCEDCGRRVLVAFRCASVVCVTSFTQTGQLSRSCWEMSAIVRV